MRWIMRVLETNPPSITFPKYIGALRETPIRVEALWEYPQHSGAKKEAEDSAEALKRKRENLNDAMKEKSESRFLRFLLNG